MKTDRPKNIRHFFMFLYTWLSGFFHRKPGKSEHRGTFTPGIGKGRVSKAKGCFGSAKFLKWKEEYYSQYHPKVSGQINEEE